MRNYHPESWSHQARRMSYNEIISIEQGWSTIQEAINFFSNSYRHPLIRTRAAKHFGRMMRAGKVHENLEAYYKNYSLERNDENA